MTANAKIPRYHQILVDPKGLCTPEWYRFFRELLDDVDGLVSSSTNADYLSAQSLDANFTSSSIDMGNWRSIAIQLEWTVTGSPVGTLGGQASNDGTTWYDYGSTTTVNGAGGALLEYNDFVPRYFRVEFLYSSGSGDTISASTVRRRY